MYNDGGILRTQKVRVIQTIFNPVYRIFGYVKSIVGSLDTVSSWHRACRLSTSMGKNHCRTFFSWCDKGREIRLMLENSIHALRGRHLIFFGELTKLLFTSNENFIGVCL